MDPLRLADAEHGNDVGVMQSGRGPGLPAESLEQDRVGVDDWGEDLEGDVPAQRFLNRLVHHAHAAPTEFADDAVVSQPGRGRRSAGLGPRLLHQGQGFQQSRKLPGQVRISARVLGH
jgi:hypothetical protein